MGGGDCFELCSNGACDSLNQSCVCDNFYGRPLDFTEEVFYCQSILFVYSFSVLFLYTFSIFLILISTTIYYTCSYNNRRIDGGYAVSYIRRNSIPQLCILLFWCCIKICEFAFVHVFNRYFIASRLFFWFSQVIGSGVHALEFSAYISEIFRVDIKIDEEDQPKLRQATKIRKKVGAKVAVDSKMGVEVDPVLNVAAGTTDIRKVPGAKIHDLVFNSVNIRMMAVIVIIALIAPVTGVFLTAFIPTWESFGQLIMASLIIIIYCSLNLGVSGWLRNLVAYGKEKAYLDDYVPTFTDSMLLLLLCIITATSTFISCLFGEYFVAEVLIAVTECLMFFRFIRVFFVIR